MVVYREHVVPAVLRPVLAGGWTLEAGAGGLRGWPVLPDGHADIVAVAGHSVLLAGPATRTHPVDVPGVGGVAGVRLRPGAVRALFGLPAVALRDEAIDLAGLWPTGRWAWDDDALAAIVDPRERLCGLCAVLARRPPGSAPPDRLVEHAVALLRAGAPSVTSLADATGLTARQLLRRFDDAIGFGPKRLQRIVRVQRVLGARRADPEGSIARIAASAGYADQAHLTREVVALTTLTPAALLDARPVRVASAD